MAQRVINFKHCPTIFVARIFAQFPNSLGTTFATADTGPINTQPYEIKPTPLKHRAIVLADLLADKYPAFKNLKSGF
jgi:hypothetical protein